MRWLWGAWLVVAACGQAANVIDGGVDAGGDATTDASNTNDAASDVVVGGDASFLDVESFGACESDGGYCFDYVGSGWTPSVAAEGCNADAGVTLVWDASCATAGRTGSCTIGSGAYEFVERCYLPLTTTQCDGLCVIFDGGFYPN